MADMFVRDIEQGIAGTGVKAGVLKCATDPHGLKEGVERSLRATAERWEAPFPSAQFLDVSSRRPRAKGRATVII